MVARGIRARLVALAAGAERIRVVIHVNVAAVAAAIAVAEPPGCPLAEDEVRPVGRVVGGRRCADRPRRVGAGQRAAGVVLCRHGDDGVIAQVVGAGRFVARRHLELGAAELLDLEAVVVGAIGRRVARRKLHARIAQVAVLRQREGHVEAAQFAHIGGTGCNLVALRVHDRVIDRGARHAIQRHVTRGAGADRTHPALDVHLFAGAVHLAVVEDEPARLVAALTLLPAVIVPVVGGLWQESHVIAQTCHQLVVGRAGQGDARHAVGVGGGLRAAGLQCQFDAGQGSAGVQRRGPGDHVALVGDGVETDVGGLHPALDDRLVAVGEDQFEQRRRCVDDDDGVAVASAQRRGQVDVGLGECIFLAVDADRRVEHFVARRPAVGVAEVFTQVGEIGRPVVGRDGIGAHAQLGHVHRVDGEGRYACRGVERGKRLARSGQIGAHAAGVEGE